MKRAPVVVIRGFRRVYPDGSGLRSATLTVLRGEFVAVLGPSGAGKSTLLNLIGLLDSATSGEYFLEGIDVSGMSERDRDNLRSRHIGFVFQASHVLADRSVLYNAGLGLQMSKIPFAVRRERVHDVLEQFGIGEKANSLGATLSGGERQRVALARAVATSPALILADEPTGNLDSENGLRVLSYLRAQASSGVAVIVVTHDRELASQADRVIHVQDGIVVDDATLTTKSSTVSMALPSAPLMNWRGRLVGLGDDALDAAAAVSGHLLRTFLLVTAFALGVGGLIAAVGLSDTASTQVSNRLTKAALNSITIDLPGGASLLGSRREGMERWLSQVRQLPHVMDAGYVATVPESTAHLRRLSDDDPAPESQVFLIAADDHYLHEMGMDITPGSASTSWLGDPRVARTAWIGQRAARHLGASGPGPDSTLWVAHTRVTIAGELASASGGSQLDSMVVVTPDVLRTSQDVRVQMYVRTELGFPASVADAIPLVLSPTNPAQFQAETVADLRDLRFGVATDLGIAAFLLGIVMLILAALGASTTMYLSILLRTPEIALRRALGAGRRRMALLFLLEGACTGLLGGALGSLMGTMVTLVASATHNWEPVLPLNLGLLAVILGCGTGVASAVVPAVIASRREPAAAIRSA